MADIHGMPDESMMVPVSGVDIQAPMGEAAISAAADGAAAVAGDRQMAAKGLMVSPAGFSAGSGTSGYDIPQGFSGEPGESWVNNVQPAAILETPIQGAGDYPGTTQDDVQKYGTS